MTPRSFDGLRSARELLVVALVDHALSTLVTALKVEHPSLVDPEPTFAHFDAPPTLRQARVIANLATALQGVLAEYCAAVDDAAGFFDDSPF